MKRESEKGSFATEIPDDAIAEALAAVEKHSERELEVVVPDAENETLKAQFAEERQLRLRALADLDNFRKRVAREREQQLLFGAEALVRDLMPVLDNMQRALEALPEGPLATGVAMTQRQLEEILKRHGLKPFKVEPGTVFDPRVHEAMMTVATAEQPAGTIVNQQLPGYFMHDRLLRPASVVVASAPAVQPEARDGVGRGDAGRDSD